MYVWNSRATVSPCGSRRLRGSNQRRIAIIQAHIPEHPIHSYILSGSSADDRRGWLGRTPFISSYSAGLKQACPNGVFVSLTPGDPSLWSGVLFVRKGKATKALSRFSSPSFCLTAFHFFSSLFLPLSCLPLGNGHRQVAIPTATSECGPGVPISALSSWGWIWLFGYFCRLCNTICMRSKQEICLLHSIFVCLVLLTKRTAACLPRDHLPASTGRCVGQAKQSGHCHYELLAGPYTTAVLRFQISFPDSYPSLPPLVTFSTDMFHPLITPLTTYMYTTDIQNNGTVSATDEERLPPGGFSLRHGFPDWFGRGGRRSRQVSGAESQTVASGPQQTPLQSEPTTTTGGTGPGDLGGISSVMSTPNSVRTESTFTPGNASYMRTKVPAKTAISTYDVLRYIRSTFDDEDVLDSVPLEAAGNPGAWHAWRTYRRQQQQKAAATPEVNRVSAAPVVAAKSAPTPSTPRRVAGGGGEWNWEGVWEERSKRCITASLSEAVLYGGQAADEVVSFSSYPTIRSAGSMSVCVLIFACVDRSTSSIWRKLTLRAPNKTSYGRWELQLLRLGSLDGINEPCETHIWAHVSPNSASTCTKLVWPVDWSSLYIGPSVMRVSVPLLPFRCLGDPHLLPKIESGYGWLY